MQASTFLGFDTESRGSWQLCICERVYTIKRKSRKKSEPAWAAKEDVNGPRQNWSERAVGENRQLCRDHNQDDHGHGSTVVTWHVCVDRYSRGFHNY